MGLLLLRFVRRPRVLGYLLNATGWLVQAATMLEITTRLVSHIGHGFSLLFCDIFSAIRPPCGPFHPELCCNLPLCGSPPPLYNIFIFVRNWRISLSQSHNYVFGNQ